MYAVIDLKSLNSSNPQEYLNIIIKQFNCNSRQQMKTFFFFVIFEKLSIILQTRCLKLSLGIGD